MSEKVRLNFRGTLFITRYSTLLNIPGTRLSKLSKEQSAEYEPDSDEFFFDRDPTYFHWILEAYSSGELHVPAWVCPSRALQEIQFWDIPYTIQPCCWKTIYENDNETIGFLLKLERDAKLINNTGTAQVNPDGLHQTKIALIKKYMGIIRHAHDNPFDSILGKVLFFIVLTATVLSLIAFALNAQLEVRVTRSIEFLDALFISTGNNITQRLTSGNESINEIVRTTMRHMGFTGKVWILVATKNNPVIGRMDLAANIVLIIDLVMRFIVSLRKLRFMVNPLNLCDLISNITVFLIQKLDNDPGAVIFESTGILKYTLPIAYSFKVFRIIRLASYAEEMKILTLSLKSSLREILFLILCFSSFSVLFGSLMFSAELHVDDYFDNVFTSVWWAVITMSTVGYGDQYPQNTIGYIIGTVTAIIGIILIALPVAVLSSNFGSFYSSKKIITKATKIQARPSENKEEKLPTENKSTNFRNLPDCDTIK